MEQLSNHKQIAATLIPDVASVDQHVVVVVVVNEIDALVVGKVEPIGCCCCCCAVGCRRRRTAPTEHLGLLDKAVQIVAIALHVGQVRNEPRLVVVVVIGEV